MREKGARRPAGERHGQGRAAPVTMAFIAILFVSCALPAGNCDDDDPDADPDGDGLLNWQEYENGTHPRKADTDGDGMWDGWELNWSFDPKDDSDGEEDPDDDGKTNADEFRDGTDPRDTDTDDDGLPNGWERRSGLDQEWAGDAPADNDTDGLNNTREYIYGTDPMENDTDGDGMHDGWELDFGLNPLDDVDGGEDADSGGVANLGEFLNDTDPTDPSDDYSAVDPGGGNGGSGIPLYDFFIPDPGSAGHSVEARRVFSPADLRWKRWQVLDTVNSYFHLNLSDPAPGEGVPSEVNFTVGPGNVFHASLALENVTAGEFVRIPSVTPDAVVPISYSDAGNLSFFRDAADNLYVRVPEDAADGNLTIYYTCVVPVPAGGEGPGDDDPGDLFYFSGKIPQGITAGGAGEGGDVPEGLLHELPDNVMESVTGFFDNSSNPLLADLRNETDYSIIVTNLSGYFSNFSGSGNIPAPGEDSDIFKEIAGGGKGAARHRAFGFMVAANALGIPVRYVSNDNHAFVEVYVPDPGSTVYNSSRWIIIDLGGEAALTGTLPAPAAPAATASVSIELDGKGVENGSRLFFKRGDAYDFTVAASVRPGGEPLALAPLQLRAGSAPHEGFTFRRDITGMNGNLNFSFTIPSNLSTGMNYMSVSTGAFSRFEGASASMEFIVYDDSSDFDSDGMPDRYELAHGFNAADPGDAPRDADDDGLTNLEEYGYASDPWRDDTDSDGMPDGWEVDYGLDLTGPDGHTDSDRGGVSNYGEYLNDTDPTDQGDDYSNDPDAFHPDTLDTGGTPVLTRVFDPTAGLEKRVLVLDSVANESDFPIRTRNRTLMGITPQPAAAPQFEERAAGLISLTLEAGVARRIPTPAPGFILLDYYVYDKGNGSILPSDQTSFFVDSARNLYILSTRDAAAQLLYFVGWNISGNVDSIPGTARAGPLENGGSYPEEIMPGLPPGLAGEVETFILASPDPLIRGLENETGVKAIITNLTAFFSSFSGGDIPEPGENESVFRAIAGSGTGAARHRAYAFMITAIYKGVPCRFVDNHGHAHVEILRPDGAWTPVLLGGTETVDYLSREDMAFHPGQVLTILTAPASARKGGSFNMTGNVTTPGRMPLSGMRVNFFLLNGSAVPAGSVQSDANGSFSLELPVPAAAVPGLNILYALSPGDATFGPGDSRETIYENKRDWETGIHAGSVMEENIPVSVGDGLTLSITGALEDSGDWPLSSRGIAVYWDGDFYDLAVTSASGDFSVQMQIEEGSTGNHTLRLLYNGTAFITGSEAVKSVTVLDARVYLNASAEPGTVPAGGAIGVSGNLTNATGAALTGTGILEVRLGGLVIGSSQVSGKDFDFNVTIPLNAGIGNRSLVIGYVPDTNYSTIYPAAQRSVPVLVTGFSTSLSIFTAPGRPGQPVLINGSLLCDAAIPVGIQKLSFDLGGYDSFTAYTDEEGNFSFYRTLPRDLPVGQLNMSASFDKSDPFLSSNTSTIMEVFSPVMLEFSTPETGEEFLRGSTVNFTVTVSDIAGRSLDNGSVDWYLDGAFFEKREFSGGTAHLDFTVPSDRSPGELTARVVFNATGYYLPAFSERDIHIVAQTFLNVTDLPPAVVAGQDLVFNGSFVTDGNDGGENITGRLSVTFGGRTGFFDVNSGGFDHILPVDAGTSAGNHTVRLEFQRTGYYLGSSTEFEISVLRRTAIGIHNSSVFAGEELSLQGVLSDISGSPLRGTAAVRWEGVWYEIETDGNGTFSLAIEIPASHPTGLYPVTGQFNGTAFRLPSSAPGFVEIFGESYLDITASPGPGSGILRNTTISFDVVLRGADGSALPGKNISFLAGGTLLDTIRTGGDGLGGMGYDYTVPVEMAPGPLDIVFSFDGDRYNTSSSNKSTYAVLAGVTIDMDLRNLTGLVLAGENITAPGRITDDVGVPLDRTVSARFIDRVFSTSSRDGKFLFTIATDTRMDPGVHVLNLSVPGLGYYLPASGEWNISIFYDTGINLTAPDAPRNTTLLVEGYLRDHAGQGLRDREIGIIMESHAGMHWLEPAVTASSGHFSFIYRIAADHPLGPVNFSAVFNGTGYLNASWANHSSSVFGHAVIHAEGAVMDRGLPVYFNATVSDDMGFPLSGIELQMELDGGYPILLATDNDGNASYLFRNASGAPVGIHRVTFRYNGTDDLAGGVRTVPVTLVAGTGISITTSPTYAFAGENISVCGVLRDDSDLPLAMDVDIHVGIRRLVTVHAADGTFNATFALPVELPAGNTSITVSLNRSYPLSYYLASNQSAALKVMRQTVLSVASDDLVRGDDVIITGRLVDSAGMPVANRTIVLSAVFRENGTGTLPDGNGIGALPDGNGIGALSDGNGIGALSDESDTGGAMELSSVVTGADGSFRFIYTVPYDMPLGPMSIAAWFRGDHLYSGSDSNTTRTVFSRTILVLSGGTFNRKGVWFNGTLFSKGAPDGTGSVPLDNMSIRLTAYDAPAGTVRVTNGMFSLPYAGIPVTGPLSLTGEFQGLGFYLPSGAGAVLNITGLLWVDAWYFEDYYFGGDLLEWEGALYDEYGGDASATLVPFIDGKPKGKIYARNGVVRFKWTVTHSLSAGRHALSFGLEREYGEGKDIQESYLVMAPNSFAFGVYRETFIYLDPGEEYRNRTTTLSGRIVDSEGEGPAGLRIRVYWGEGITGEAVSGAHGEFEIDHFIPPGEDVGWKDVGAVYEPAAGEYFLASRTVDPFKIISGTALEIDVPARVKHRDPFEVRLRLIDDRGAGVAGAKLRIEMHGENTSVLVGFTDANGSYSFETFFANSSGITISVSFTGSNFYDPSSTSASVEGVPPGKASGTSDMSIYRVTAGAALLALAGAFAGRAFYRRHRLRRVATILEEAAESLGAGDDYRRTIMNAYNAMCREFSLFGIIRLHFETVREFEEHTRGALPLADPELELLRRLFEVADYSIEEPTIFSRDRAVKALHTIVDAIKENLEYSRGEVVIGRGTGDVSASVAIEDPGVSTGGETEAVVEGEIRGPGSGWEIENRKIDGK